MLVCTYIFLSILIKKKYFLGQHWQEEGLAIILAELVGFAAGSEALTVAALASMLGNFGFGNYGAGLENAIQVFAALEVGPQAQFLELLKRLGSASGIHGMETLLNNFASFLELRAAENFLIMPQTPLGLVFDIRLTHFEVILLNTLEHFLWTKEQLCWMRFWVSRELVKGYLMELKQDGDFIQILEA